MIDSSAVSASVAALIFVKDIAASFLGERDAAKLADGVAQIQQQLTSQIATLLALQQEHSAVLGERDDLIAEIRKIKEKQRELQRYDLTKLASGQLVYMRKATAKPIQPAHYACPNCFDGQQQKSVLQLVSEGRGLLCPACKTIFRLAAGEWPKISMISRGLT